MPPLRFDPSVSPSAATGARGRYFFFVPCLPGSPGLSLHQGGLEVRVAGARLGRSEVQGHILALIVTGSGRLISGRRTLEISPGHLLLHHPGEQYQIVADAGGALVNYWLEFAGDKAEAFLAELTLAAQPMPPAALPRIRELFSRIVHAGEAGGVGGSRSAGILLEVLLAQIQVAMRSHAERAPSTCYQSYERCLLLIETEFPSLRSVACLARRAGFDASYVSRLFHRFDQEQPYRKLLRLKMERAAQLLAQGSLIVKECAAAVGFDDQLHFSRVFKRHFGAPPREFLYRRGPTLRALPWHPPAPRLGQPGPATGRGQPRVAAR